MRTTNTFGVQFITRTNKAKDGLLPIYARVTVDGHRVEISLKRWIKPGDWNGTKGMAKGSREEIKSLNHYLDEVRARIMECYQEMQVQKRLITADAIKSMFFCHHRHPLQRCALGDRKQDVGSLQDYNHSGVC